MNKQVLEVSALLFVMLLSFVLVASLKTPYSISEEQLCLDAGGYAVIQRGASTLCLDPSALLDYN